ncbi:MAG: hypothetical protein GY809_16675, partial [Planctomycetes bacterium]|nr:hypothetical protein [Planctomycetota bacterium]
MQTKQIMALALGLVILAAGSSFAQEASCTDCHNDTTIITGKQLAHGGSVHGSGTAAAYAGARGSCTACHSGASFSAMVAEGQTPGEFKTVVDVTRQDCRACHAIHTSYTTEDWALETTDPVMLYAFEASSAALFDGGKGNLCANCHQPRRQIAAPDADGNIAVTSTHWGPHHGPQSAMLLGIGGAGAVEGETSYHFRLIEDSCVTCHIGENMSHDFKSVSASCVECHAESDDIDGAMAAVAAKLDELHDLLEVAGLYHDGHPVVGVYPAAQAEALWNYIFIAVEDG